MVVDTQEIIEMAHMGDMDYVKHALTLFTDFIAVFVRILIIMVSCVCKCCVSVGVAWQISQNGDDICLLFYS